MQSSPSVTLNQPALLVAVDPNIPYQGASCTRLTLDFGGGKQEFRYMKTSTWDKNFAITRKAQNLIGKHVTTSCWDPVAQPGLWSNQGYFNDLR